MGKVIMSGIVPQLEYEVPVKGIIASELAIGSTVKLLENGTAVEYLVVHNGLPSSLYDSSCDGLWLLRKQIYSVSYWAESSSGKYSSSYVHSYLNNTFLGIFDADTKSQIKSVKVPYVTRQSSGTVASGASGLSTKVFLLAVQEVGLSGQSYMPSDGVKLDYFDSSNSKRIAYYNGTATSWWSRSWKYNVAAAAWGVGTSGSYWSGNVLSNKLGIRPALILPSTALFDEETLILKGVV